MRSEKPINCVRLTSVGIFRTEDGAHVSGNTLQIQLNHFVPSPIATDLEAFHQQIVIPYKKLADFLDEAEIFNKTSEQGIEDQFRPGVKKRVRESTPTDELGPEDEERFQERGIRRIDAGQ